MAVLESSITRFLGLRTGRPNGVRDTAWGLASGHTSSDPKIPQMSNEQKEYRPCIHERVPIYHASGRQSRSPSESSRLSTVYSRSATQRVCCKLNSFLPILICCGLALDTTRGPWNSLEALRAYRRFAFDAGSIAAVVNPT